MAEEEMADLDAAPPEESSNRLFILLAILLGSVFVLGLLCIGLYAVFLGPRQASLQATQVAEVNFVNTETAAQNLRVAAEMTQVVLDRLATDAAQAEATQLAQVPTNTPTPVVRATATDTPVPTVTRDPVQLTMTAEAAMTQTAAAIVSGGETATATSTSAAGTPTRLPTRTPTRAAGATATAGGPTATPTRIATALPDTGFADDVGVPGLLMLGGALIGVVIIARRLRLALR